jgi:hypothetical protein
MPTTEEKSVRLVIQFVRRKGSVLPSYHVIVYPEPKGSRNPLKLPSREQLLQRLSEATPDFDENLCATELATLR